MRQRIIYTRFDGGVNDCQPSDEVKAFMTRGGGWYQHIGHWFRGYREYEIEKMINHGHSKRLAVKFVDALDVGGLTDAEYFEIIREHDCAKWGTGFELWDVDDVPTDRWFRNAWHRSANGGPISIDLEKARPIQAAHIDSAVKAANKRTDGVMKFFTLQRPMVKVNFRHIANRIKDAKDEFQLRAIWPEGLAA